MKAAWLYRSLVAPTKKTMQYPDSWLNLPQSVNLADLQKQREEKEEERKKAGGQRFNKNDLIFF